MSYSELIKCLEPKLKAIAKKVSRKYTYLDKDDFYQEAVIYLWKMWESNEINDNTQSYLLQGCYYFLKNYIRTVSKAIDNNRISINSHYDYGEENMFDHISRSYSADSDAVEIFLLCDSVDSVFTDREKDIFYCKLEGYTTREIGIRIGVSHVMVSKIENNMRMKCSGIRKEIFY
ncbi:MAG: sigma-70 family RNA polymerase sigma factor [Candidatus Omnitrophica bacterium]|jgi:RNA polymerase sigma factor (sigma-70 family)|nr:sigma-70 family RNA polymerase sigma factor [Candidatus Omnitrophota bacterium]